MKIGIDFHGVIDVYPKFFQSLTTQMIEAGHEIHILTGQSRSELEDDIHKFGVEFTHFYSIVDYHMDFGTDMERVDGRWTLDTDVWDKSKAAYANHVSLDLHFDDSYRYLEEFPSSCTSILVRKGFESHMRNLIGTIAIAR